MSGTYARQSELPALPIPELEKTLDKFLLHLKALETDEQHEESKRTVLEFLNGDGPRLQTLLVDYDLKKRTSGEIGSYVGKCLCKFFKKIVFLTGVQL